MHILPLGADVMDDEQFKNLRRFTARFVQAAEQLGSGLDLVVLIGGRAPHSSSHITGAQLIEAIQEECINAGAADFPLVVSAPGPSDMRPVPSSHMLVDTLVRRWPDIDTRIWRGEQEDVVEALEQRVFPDYLAWQRAVAAELPGWHPGVLPGEGSLVIKAREQRIGVVVVNAVFRGVGSVLDSNHIVLSDEQLRRAVGEPWEIWAADNALTVVVSGLSAPLPRLLDAQSPTLLLSGGTFKTEFSSRQTWLAADPKRLAYLEVDLNKTGAPVVRDLAHRVKKANIPLLQPAHTSARSGALTKGHDPEQVLADFYRQVESGQMIAVLVSGLPGDPPVTELDTLRRQLAEDVFGQIPQPEPGLHEIWSAALAHLSSVQLEDRLGGLTGDQGFSCQDLHRMLSAPWWRVYDFSASGAIKGLAEGKQSDLPLVVTDALAEKPGDRKGVREVTAMNGSFDGRFASVDFSMPAVDAPSARALWFNRLKAEIVYHPVVFFVASASSAEFWHIFSCLNIAAGTNRYPRFIVTPEAGHSELGRIQYSGLRHIRQMPTSFVVERLRPGNQSVENGKRRLVQSLAAREFGTGISLVSTMVSKAGKGSKEFLKGNEPEWGDITGSFAAELSVSNRILNEASKFNGHNRGFVLLRGAAGSGKTTALMQCAYRLQQNGNVVGWVDRSATKSLAMIRAEALDVKLDAIFVDDVDIFGDQAASLLRDLTAGGKTLVVAAVRNTKLDFVPGVMRAANVSADDPLSDDDLKSLIKVLKTHGLLGVLKKYRWSSAKCLQELRQLCERSLLVAMIQVVSGQLFEDKVRSEFGQLKGAQALAYATICVLESAEVFKARGIEPVDLLQIVSPGVPSVQMEEAISSLIAIHLVVQAPNGTLRCRHRTIADTVVKVVLKRRTALLGEVIKSLLRFYAGYAGSIDDSDNPYRRTMVRLLNHALMIEFRLPDELVREIYDSVHEFLEYDFHYWLQRGEFELQRNHLGIAANYFQSARGCGGEGDYKVETGWASVTFRRSTADPGDSNKIAAALNVLKTLDDVCRTRGRSSGHSFVVMIIAGTEWLEKVGKLLLESDFSASVSTIKGIIELGRKVCGDSFQFDRAVREYEPRLSRLVERNRGVPT